MKLVISPQSVINLRSLSHKVHSVTWTEPLLLFAHPPVASGADAATLPVYPGDAGSVTLDTLIIILYDFATNAAIRGLLPRIDLEQVDVKTAIRVRDVHVLNWSSAVPEPEPTVSTFPDIFA